MWGDSGGVASAASHRVDRISSLEEFYHDGLARAFERGEPETEAVLRPADLMRQQPQGVRQFAAFPKPSDMGIIDLADADGRARAHNRVMPGC